MKHKVSVIVLTKNRLKELVLCLDSISKQEYDNIEYIIVDSNSNEEVYEQINNYAALWTTFGREHKIIQAGECSIGRARQIGFENSTGDIIAYIDSDVELPHRHWIENMLMPFAKPSVAGVQTLAKYRETDHPMLKRVHNSFEYKSNRIDIDHYEPVGTSHILIRRIAIESAGGFKDINFKEDTDLTHRIMKQGHYFVYLSTEKCYHHHIDGYKSYFKKMFRNKTQGAICMLKGVQ